MENFSCTKNRTGKKLQSCQQHIAYKRGSPSAQGVIVYKPVLEQHILCIGDNSVCYR